MRVRRSDASKAKATKTSTITPVAPVATTVVWRIMAEVLALRVELRLVLLTVRSSRMAWTRWANASGLKDFRKSL